MSALSHFPAAPLPALSLLLAGFSGFLAAQAADVTLRDGRTVEAVRILRDDPSGVEAREGVATHVWPAEEIGHVSYRVAPEAWKKAWSHWSAGAFAEAAPLFAEAATRVAQYPWIPAYAGFHRAESLRRSGASYADTRAAFEAVAALDPPPRFAPEALLALVRLHRARGADGAAEARKALARLDRLAESVKLPGRILLHARVIGAALDAPADPRKAAAVLAELAPRGRDAPDVAAALGLELGRVHELLGQAADAERRYREALAGPAETSAPAANALGDLLVHAGRPGEALLIYSRTYVLHENRAELREDVGHALHAGAGAFAAEAARIRAADPRKAARHEERAGRLLRKAAKEFADTAGGGQARRELGL